MNGDIFKAYDIRGLVPAELNKDNTYVIGQALAEFLSTKYKDLTSEPIVVGHDMRPDSANLAQALTEGLRQQGRNVADIGQVSTDMVYFATVHLKAAGGAMITASHNPKGYNGIKLCDNTATPIGHGSGMEEIRQLVLNSSFTPKDKGSFEKKDVMDAWIGHALSFAKNLKAYQVAVDAGNGMAGKVIPHLVGKSPLKITPLYFELDGNFPNHEANPMKPETLVDLCKLVKSDGVDFGLAFDGDGDRVALVDEAGRPVDGSITFALLAWNILLKYPGASIVYDLRMSRSALEFIKSKGGKLVRSKVGNPSIKQAMHEHEAPLGGETTGHFVMSDNYYIDSGLVAAIVTIDTLSSQDIQLKDFVDEVTRYVRLPELNFLVKDKQGAIDRLADVYKDGRQDFLDGLSVEYEDWWFNVRPSNTEPVLRLNIEAKDAKTLKQQEKALAKIITA